jgi:hypothetical protein
MPMSRLARRVLLAPDFAARAAARAASAADEAWMLGQPRDVRASYVAEVVDGGGDPQVWMLRQRRAVRESYIRDVLEA